MNEDAHVMRPRLDKISIIYQNLRTGYPRGDPSAILVTITFHRKHLIFANKTATKQAAFQNLLPTRLYINIKIPRIRGLISYCMITGPASLLMLGRWPIFTCGFDNLFELKD